MINAAFLMLWLIVCIKNLFNSADFACFQPDLDSVWMMSRSGQHILDYADSEPSAALILLLHYVYSQSWLYVSVSTVVHNLTSPA